MSFQPLKGLLRPPVEGRGWIRTLNRTGNATVRPDPYSQRLIDVAAHAPEPLLDVGAAYGVATLPALAAGCSVVAVPYPGNLRWSNDRNKRVHNFNHIYFKQLCLFQSW